MREILFRGKRRDNGNWVEGNLFIPNRNDTPTQILIGTNFIRIPYDINPETVGQYTGLKDKNGKKIFEGDIIKSENDLNCDSGNGQVIWLDEHGLWYVNEVNNGLGYLTRSGFVEVIGNIHDNPELLNGEED